MYTCDYLNMIDMLGIQYKCFSVLLFLASYLRSRVDDNLFSS